MENFRSMSTREGNMQIETYYGGGPTNMQDLRSYSTNSYYSYGDKEVKIKKSKSRISSSSSSRNWAFNDPELQRKKRVLGYKSYAMEDSSFIEN
ncbi:hypothetical protein H5410_019126 [Solanum commersonii]|uniref:Uncharacterized protein n=1 Tax=Solanum commersonii TaxID=4109 RepID=A0A9J6A3V6_SOLCO|nr:hypothetical protein H5410_019126 [Solanum commersonii]